MSTCLSVDPQALREAAWARLGREVFDVLIVGGGINGAACARDAALRGMSVALVEREDFASGTSSRSSKLIHGGVRYLEQGEVGLVLEACRERDLLRSSIAPHLVRAQRFVFPIYEDDGLPVWQLRVGLLMYDVLAGFRNVERHSGLSAAELHAHEPALLTDRLRGGALYYDCWTDDARLTLETALAARDQGAVLLNHAAVIGLDNDSTGRIAEARVRDALTGRTKTVRARSFVNVAGPWLDRVRALDDPGAPPRLRATKGVHAVFDRHRIGNNDAIVIRGLDDRVMFAIPWQGQTLVGTTDTYYDGDPADVAADSDDLDYILTAVNRAFPRADVTASDVISTYAGLRPLVAPESEKSESDVSRDDEIFESPSGLISLGGGKLTTHRHVAERIVDRVAERIGRTVGRCRTATTPLPGARGIEAGATRIDVPGSADEHLADRYGALAAEVRALINADGELVQPLVGDQPDLGGQVRYSVLEEMAVSIEDVLSRRLQVDLRSREVDRELVQSVATLVAGPLGWDAERVQEEIDRYDRCHRVSREIAPKNAAAKPENH